MKTNHYLGESLERVTSAMFTHPDIIICRIPTVSSIDTPTPVHINTILIFFPGLNLDEQELLCHLIRLLIISIAEPYMASSSSIPIGS